MCAGSFRVSTSHFCYIGPRLAPSLWSHTVLLPQVTLRFKVIKEELSPFSRCENSLLVCTNITLHSETAIIWTKEGIFYSAYVWVSVRAPAPVGRIEAYIETFWDVTCSHFWLISLPSKHVTMCLCIKWVVCNIKKEKVSRRESLMCLNSNPGQIGTWEYFITYICYKCIYTAVNRLTGVK